MVLDSFMESYNRNVVIKGNDSELAAFFENVQPCTYESAIETFFEAQYSVEAMAAITQNAIMMESAGAAEVMNEGVVGSFVSAAWQKVKECASKVKEFAVAVVKKIVDFFHELYMKNSPIDKAMQLYGKNAVSYSDISAALANGYKIPGNMKILTKDAEGSVEDIMHNFDEIGNKYLDKGFNLFNASSFAAEMRADAENFTAKITALNEELTKAKEEDKAAFTWVGQLLSDNDAYTKKNQLKQFIRKANDGNKDTDGHITADEWKVITDYALNGQSKIKIYKDSVQKEAKEAVKKIEDTGKQFSKHVNDIQDTRAQNNPDDASDAARVKANASKYVSAAVTVCTYQANRSVRIMQQVVLPVMKKMHNTAISTFVSINGSVKRVNKKATKVK